MACDYRKLPSTGYPTESDVNGIFAGEPVILGGGISTPGAPEFEVEVENTSDSVDASLIWADEDYTLILSEEDGEYIFLDNVF